jgi:hypothetical protein
LISCTTAKFREVPRDLISCLMFLTKFVYQEHDPHGEGGVEARPHQQHEHITDSRPSTTCVPSSIFLRTSPTTTSSTPSSSPLPPEDDHHAAALPGERSSIRNFSAVAGRGEVPGSSPGEDGEERLLLTLPSAVPEEAIPTLSSLVAAMRD